MQTEDIVPWDSIPQIPKCCPIVKLLFVLYVYLPLLAAEIITRRSLR